MICFFDACDVLLCGMGHHCALDKLLVRLVEEKEAAEAKYQAKRKELKEVEKRLIGLTSTGETEKAVL